MAQTGHAAQEGGGGIRFEQRETPAWQIAFNAIEEYKGFLIVALVVLWYLWRRSKKKAPARPATASRAATPTGASSRDVERASERVMVHEVKRSKLVEQLQQQYEEKAKEAEERRREKARLEAEERAKRLAEAAASASKNDEASVRTRTEYNPLMGTGAGGASGFKSDRCNRRGG